VRDRRKTPRHAQDESRLQSQRPPANRVGAERPMPAPDGVEKVRVSASSNPDSSIQYNLVCWMVNSYPFVAIKMARRQGATRARYRCVSQPRSNAGAGPFSSQPFGPGDFGRFSALFARAVSQRIQPLRSRLEKHQNSLRQMHRYLPSSTLGLRSGLRYHESRYLHGSTPDDGERDWKSRGDCGRA